MLKRILPYTPYLVVIISLIVAIFMVVKLNGAKIADSVKKETSSHTEKVETATAGNAAKTSNPTYTVKTAPTPTLSPTSSSSKPAPVVVTSNIKQTPATQPATKTVVVTNTATAPAPVTKGGAQLTNTGPGEVIALFAISTFAATALHTVYLRKKITV